MKTKKEKTNKPKTKKPIVIVRDNMAGIHVGTLDWYDLEKRTCALTNARKIWSWCGAGSCHGLAAEGLDQKNSRVAPMVSRVETCNVVEIVWCSAKGAKSCLEAPKWE